MEKNLALLMAGMPEVPSKRIVIDFIDHKDQRYETVGDYVETDTEVHIFVSKMRPHYEFLVALHELIEVYLVRSAGVKIDDIDNFDKAFEAMRNLYPQIVGDEEPGNSPNAPYYDFHQIASRIEKYFADTLKVDYNEYDKAVNSLSQD